MQLDRAYFNIMVCRFKDKYLSFQVLIFVLKCTETEWKGFHDNTKRQPWI